jgi:hypothetical protein
MVAIAGLKDEFPEDCVRLRRSVRTSHCCLRELDVVVVALHCRFVADIGWAEKTFDEGKTLDENGFTRNNSLCVVIMACNGLALVM